MKCSVTVILKNHVIKNPASDKWEDAAYNFICQNIIMDETMVTIVEPNEGEFSPVELTCTINKKDIKAIDIHVLEEYK